MATGGLYGSTASVTSGSSSTSESIGLYGNTTAFGGSYFEWFIFQEAATQPATPTGGSWDFTTNTGTVPSGWTQSPPTAPTNEIWVSIALVNSKTPTTLTWSTPGLMGVVASTTVGTTTTGAPGTSASVTNSGTSVDAVLNFTIPRGDTGATGATGPQGIPGDAATIAAGTTTTGAPGTSASVVNSGTSSAAVFDFTIPRGDTGATGPQGDAATIAVGTTTTGLPGTSATVTNSGTSSAAVFDFTIPAGEGVLAGGTTGQFLAKASNTDYDTTWLSITGGLSYLGTWNASTNTPTLTSGAGTAGGYYVVNTSGTTNLDGITDWVVGDWAIFNGTTWQKIDQSWATAGANSDITSLSGLTGGISSPDFVQFNTGATPTPAQGMIWWDGGSTMNMQMTANVTAEVAQDNFIHYKASSAVTFGQLCVFTGVVGASGVITAAPAGAGITNPQYIIGIAAESVALNGTGLIQILGDLRGFDTTGSAYGQTWADGDILYYNSVSGGLTNVYPTSGPIVTVAAVIHAGSGGSGSVLIRPTITQRLTAGTATSVFQTTAGASVSVTNVPIANGGTGQTTANDAFNALAPSQTSNSGKYLTTNGSTTSWATVDALPSQTGHAGQYLTTDGSVASWATVASGNITPEVLYEMANAISTNYTVGTGNNAVSSGPITINSGASVSVPTGSRWAIV